VLQEQKKNYTVLLTLLIHRHTSTAGENFLYL